MPVYHAFSIPTLGMKSQSHSLNNIGHNIANVNTGGFKRTDTNFSTLLSNTYFEQSDIGGVRPDDKNTIKQQGHMVTSARDLDVAINGDGFFIFNSKLDGSGKNLYGRDGSFDISVENDISITADDGSTITTKDGYLIDKNGHYLQGWTADPSTGLFTNTSLSALRVDQYAFANTGLTTTTANLELNLPSNDSSGAGQGDSIVLAGTIEANDTYSVTVNGTTVTYTVLGSEANLDAVRDALVSAINADATVGALVTASASPTTGTLTITGKTLGQSLTTGAAATNVGATADNAATLSNVQSPVASTPNTYNIEVIDSNGNARSAGLNFSKTSTNNWELSVTTPQAPVAQVDTVTMTGTFEVGDSYTAVINGVSISYTAAASDTTLNNIRDGLIANINSNTSVNSKVTAAATGTGIFTLTSDTAGTAFTTTVSAANGGATADNAATVATTTANTETTVTNTVTTLTFDANGALTSPSAGTVSLSMSFPAKGTYAAGTASVTMDVSKLTQFAGDFLPFSYTKNGYAASTIRNFRFDDGGRIVATFDNSTYRAIYKVPLAQFSNPDGLGEINGNVYEETELSGSANVVDAATTGFASFLPNTHELSNVDLAGEFSRMIMTQAAYNSSATVFKTVDEMITSARDLKR